MWTREDQDRYDALAAHCEKLEAERGEWQSDTRRFEAQTELYKTHVTRQRQRRRRLEARLSGCEQFLEESHIRHVVMIQTTETLREENERMSAAYNLMLAEHIEARKEDIILERMYSEHPELEAFLVTREDEFLQRSKYLPTLVIFFVWSSVSGAAVFGGTALP